MEQQVQNGIIIDLTNSGQSLLEYSPPIEVVPSGDRRYLEIEDEKDYYIFCNICQYADPLKQFLHGTKCTHVIHREVCLNIFNCFVFVNHRVFTIITWLMRNEFSLFSVYQQKQQHMPYLQGGHWP